MSRPDSLDARLSLWLSARGLRDNPFAHWSAEQEPDLPCYFVDVERFDELLAAAEPCVVFAARGCGKTAQRRMLAAQCRPEQADARRLAVHYGYDGFRRALKLAGDDLTRLQADHHAAAILRLGLAALQEAVRRDAPLGAALQRSDRAFSLAALQRGYAPELLPPGVALASAPAAGLDPIEHLSNLVALLADCGLGPLVVLVDGLDEFLPMADDPARIADFLAPLLGTLPLIEREGLAFKFFLPQKVEEELCRRLWFRRDRLRFFHVTWTEQALQAMLGQRLAHFSSGGGRVYTQLGQLCRPELAGRLDAELVSLVEGRPRFALALADLLLRTHCQASAPAEQITVETWEAVKAVWETRKADFLGVGESSRPAPPQPTPVAAWSALFVDEKAQRVWVGETEITSEMTAQEFRVLLCLYRHADSVCDKDLLVEEAWPEVAVRDGVTDQALAATISRLRKLLKQPSPERGYIETIKGRGYRLHPQGFGPAG